MRLPLLFCLLLAPAFAALAEPEPKAERTDAEVHARSAALEVAGAFSNDGFKIRDSHWQGSIAPAESRLFQVNLYAGNEYWFVAAGGEEGANVALTLFNEDGQPVATEAHTQPGRAAAGFAPAASGPYYIRVEASGATGGPVCLLYCYK